MIVSVSWQVSAVWSISVPQRGMWVKWRCVRMVWQSSQGCDTYRQPFLGDSLRLESKST